MKIFKTALLLSGLFFAHLVAADVPSYDPNDKKPAVEKSSVCAWAPPPLGGETKSYGCGDTQSEAVGKAAEAYAQALTGACGEVPGRTTCSVSVNNVKTDAAEFDQSYSYECKTGWPPVDDICSASHTKYRFQVFAIHFNPKAWTCPPTQDNFSDAQNEPLKKYTIGPIEESGTKLCFKPLEPLDCSALQGIQPSISNDSFVTGDAYTTDNPPSCITKCATDENGATRCADCKVVSKSWGRQAVGNGLTKWWANAGTFTGASCGAEESEVPPPDSPKCWETKNGLTMCIQDPEEKCTTINGVQQCEAGCGYINQEFYCKDVEPDPKPDPNDKDKPLPDVDDNISDPAKPISDMVKGDFKDVQRGVESRVGQVVTGVGNLENSVDALGLKLDDINDKLEYSNGTEDAANNLLKGIKDGVEDISSGMGEGDEDGDGQGGDGECDPLKGEDCAETGGVVSWWNSPYEDGFSGMVKDNMKDFTESDVYQSLTTELTLSGGGSPDFEICFNFGFANFGCGSLAIPPLILSFIKAAFLFYAGILARRLLIGA